MLNVFFDRKQWGHFCLMIRYENNANNFQPTSSTNQIKYLIFVILKIASDSDLNVTINLSFTSIIDHTQKILGVRGQNN
jgi:hypothetical protein